MVRAVNKKSLILKDVHDTLISYKEILHFPRAEFREFRIFPPWAYLYNNFPNLDLQAAAPAADRLRLGSKWLLQNTYTISIIFITPFLSYPFSEGMDKICKNKAHRHLRSCESEHTKF